jgi:hypothetical protein
MHIQNNLGSGRANLAVGNQSLRSKPYDDLNHQVLGKRQDTGLDTLFM